ncbi:hypothetical protein G6F61_015095 [Rhizopus arrhizus]|nr:hypothetical protein G6F61_015095 [Rhizopus arrhizus]
MVRSNATAAEGACLESSDGTQLPGRAMPRPGSVSGGGSLLSVSLLAKSHPRGTSDAASANHFVQHKPQGRWETEGNHRRLLPSHDSGRDAVLLLR